MDDETLNSINIRPGVSILSVLKHLNYKPWYALAEFVDNSIQSYLDNKDELLKLEGPNYKLKVDIEIDINNSGAIKIRDNAAGIFKNDFPRAFRPAEIPPDSSGLNEFGMGMKSAACWFSNQFIVRTGALGEGVAREVKFEVNKIVNDSIEELDILTNDKEPDVHYTSILLSDLQKPIRGNTLKKISDHLTEIYRVFTRENILDLSINGKVLDYKEPSILKAPIYNNLDGEAIVWKKDINFDFGQGQKVHGFAAIREKGAISNPGFSLFRKSRVIVGSGDEGYKPEYVFGKTL